MYTWGEKCVQWIGGKRPFYVSWSVWVREINHSFEGCGTLRSAEGPESQVNHETLRKDLSFL
jgi:hypothetical protein